MYYSVRWLSFARPEIVAQGARTSSGVVPRGGGWVGVLTFRTLRESSRRPVSGATAEITNRRTGRVPPPIMAGRW